MKQKVEEYKTRNYNIRIKSYLPFPTPDAKSGDEKS